LRLDPVAEADQRGKEAVVLLGEHAGDEADHVLPGAGLVLQYNDKFVTRF
jgi:hypothetical protein